MGATHTKSNQTISVEEQTLRSVRQLLTELGGSRGLEELSGRGAAAHLERDLGLGSLERVELMLRLGNACGVRLPDQAVADANTVQDLIDATMEQLRNGNAPAAHGRNASGAIMEPGESRAAGRADLEREIRSAETLTEILRLRGLGEPERAHVLLYEEDEARAITFGDLYEHAAAIAADLQGRGLEPGQTVAIMLPTCAEFFYTFAGTLLAGGIPVPIYPPFRADRIAEYATRQANILRNAETRFLVTFRRAEGLARLLQPRVPTLREVLNAQRLAGAGTQRESEPQPTKWRAVEHLLHTAKAAEICFLQYTSGSTGDPKGVTLTHANLLANIRAMMEAVDLVPEDIAISWLPLYHDMGLIGMWLVPLFSGNPTVIMSPLSFLSRPERWLQAIHRHRGTVSPAPNFAYELCVRRIQDKDIDGIDLSCWRAAFNGAEPVHADTLGRFTQRFASHGLRPTAMVPVYGLAEATLAVSVPKIGLGYRVDHIDRELFELQGRAVPVASGDAAQLEFVGSGKPLSNMEVKIVSDDGRELGDRLEGRLCFRSPSATSGYYHNPKATSALLREDGWLDSGDRAYRVDGELFITGRAKDLIIKAGRKLYPHEIEDTAGRVTGVRTGCVVAFGAPDERSGTERFVVAGEMRAGGDRNQISAQVSAAVQDAVGVPPDVIELLPPQSIPKTSSGKLRRSETKRLYLAGLLGKKQPPVWAQVARLAARSALPRAWNAFTRGARRAVAFLYGVWALTAFAAFLIPAWAIVSVISDPKRAARVVHSATRAMLYVAGIRVHLKNGELLAQLVKSGPWIFAPNHSSYIDILALLAYLPGDVRFVVKGEALEMPIFGRMARRTGQLTFNRSDPQARVRETEEIEAALSRGESVVVYPEGTFTAVAGVRPFQLGAFKAAVDTQRPICAVSTRGAREILRDKTYLPRPGYITVTLGPLVLPMGVEGDRWPEIVRLRDATRDIIARNSGEPLL